MSNKQIDLPEKLSDGINLALDDLAKVETMPRYKVDMGTWHTPYRRMYNSSMLVEAPCMVCLAGAVMCRAIRIEQSAEPNDFDDRTHNKLLALNCARLGKLHVAVTYWHPQYSTEANKLPENLREVFVPSYSQGACAFHTSLRELSRLLRSFDL